MATQHERLAQSLRDRQRNREPSRLIENGEPITRIGVLCPNDMVRVLCSVNNGMSQTDAIQKVLQSAPLTK